MLHKSMRIDCLFFSIFVKNLHGFSSCPKRYTLHVFKGVSVLCGQSLGFLKVEKVLFGKNAFRTVDNTFRQRFFLRVQTIQCFGMERRSCASFSKFSCKFSKLLKVVMFQENDARLDSMESSPNKKKRNPNTLKNFETHAKCCWMWVNLRFLVMACRNFSFLFRSRPFGVSFVPKHFSARKDTLCGPSDLHLRLSCARLGKDRSHNAEADFDGFVSERIEMHLMRKCGRCIGLGVQEHHFDPINC